MAVVDNDSEAPPVSSETNVTVTTADVGVTGDTHPPPGVGSSTTSGDGNDGGNNNKTMMDDEDVTDDAVGTNDRTNNGPFKLLTFEGLRVHVPGKKKSCCDYAAGPFANFAQEYLGMQVKEHEPFDAIKDVSGYLELGQMCLVMGGRQQSRSTLLRTLSGRSSEHDETSGTILLNGMPLGQSLQGWRRLCPYISAVDNTHSPVLTVRETFGFAAQCTSDGKRSTAEIDTRVGRMMEALSLENVADTVVGDENLRGVSGGQKRRVTVGEMAIDRETQFLFCENITDGLSSNDSLQILQRLQRACRSIKIGAMVTLMQPSDEMVALFDTIMVLTTTSEMAYFGPVDRTVLTSIFAPTKDGSLAGVEYNGSVADLVEDYIVQPNADELEKAIQQRYTTSKTYREVSEKLDEIRSATASAGDLDVSDLLPSTKYSTHGWYQFTILTSRRKKLIFRNAVTLTRIFIAVFFGIIIGSLFSQLTQGLVGALGRTGYLFLNCFLVLMLSAAVTIPSSFRERVTLFKHRSAEFYSGRIAYLVQIITDMPLSLLEAILLSTVSYFWIDMRPGAGPFFYFMFTLIGLEFVGQALGRLLCALLRKQVTANAASSVVILVMGTVGGFMPSYQAIPPILRWISWVTPVSYAFEGLMINQFSGADFELDLASISVEGAIPLNGVGDKWLEIYNLPRIAFASNDGIKIFDIAMLFVFALVYDFIGVRLIEYNRAWFFNQTRKPVSIVKQSFSMDAPKLLDLSEKASSVGIADEMAEKVDQPWPQSLAVQGLCYDVRMKSPVVNPFKKMRKLSVRLSGNFTGKKPDVEDLESEQSGSLRLLHTVNARFTRGRMCALMGTSGAGKTTLMDVIAGYKTGGSIIGDILIDGFKKDERVWKKISGYAEQQDLLNPYLTLDETIRFTANCRLSKSKDKLSIISNVLSLMQLEQWRNVIVGREVDGEGLPKDARKRLTIAIQLAIEPKILFLDEPTTGLSQTEARLVIESVKRATDHYGLITLATIHQPSFQIWSAFDDACLLVRGGRVAYMGPCGESSGTILAHFESMHGVTPPKGCNPADYCLTILNSVNVKDAEVRFQESEQSRDLVDRIQYDMANSRETPAVDTARANNALVEIGLLTVRHLIVQWRNPSYCFVRIFSSIVMSLYMGILFNGDKSVLSGAVFSIGAIFFLVFVLVIPMQAAVVPLVEDRSVLYRETVSGTYSRLSYGIGQLLADQPFHILNAFLMWVCFYFLVDFRRSGGEMGYFLLMLYLANWVIQSLGQLFALASPNEESANGLGGLSVILSVILMGFLITESAMPSGWQWAYWVNLFRYMLQGLCTNELGGNDYFVNLTGILPGVVNATGILGFSGAASSVVRHQAASLVSMASMGGGVNVTTSGISGRDLIGLVNCTLTNGCFADESQSFEDAFRACYLTSGISFPPPPPPPCRTEFFTAIEGIDVTEVLRCVGDFLTSDSDPRSLSSVDLAFIKTDNSIETKASGFVSVFLPDAENGGRNLQSLPELVPTIFNGTSTPSETLDFIRCMMGVLFPNVAEAIAEIVKVLQSLLAGLIPIFVRIIGQGGIYLSGDVILAFFGWAEWDGEQFSAPWKWWYCLVAVIFFLVGIEISKLVAINFIVWTRR